MKFVCSPIDRLEVGRCASPRLMRWVVGYEGLYMVHRDGYVVNRLAQTMTTKIDRYGYANVRLNRDGEQKWKKIHRLVCEAWHGPCPGGHECAHLDSDPLNNSPDNLAWVTRKENTAHKKMHGRNHGGRSSALSAETIEEIKHPLLSSRKAAEHFGISQSHVVRIRNGINCTAIAGPSQAFVSLTRNPSLEPPARFEPTVKSEGDIVL